MSNTNSKLSELFMDATKEVVEKGRIKAQMNRLEKIMRNDLARLKDVYAGIGKLYLSGAIARNKGKVMYATKEAEHLKARLERAAERYKMLEEAHSVDDCTSALKTELTAKLKNAKDSTVAAAKKATQRAQDAVSSKSSKPTVRVKSGSFTSADAIARRSAAVAAAKKQKNSTANFLSLLEDLGIKDTDIDATNKIELTPAECAEISAILDSLDAELAEEKADAVVTVETPEETSDGETAENFDF